MADTTLQHDEQPEAYELGDRLLYLRTPNFKGKDVEQLQTALGALGFQCGGVTGVFGAYTEGALRKFQLNMGLEADGIAGINTYATLRHLHNAWADKPLVAERSYMGFARVADALERHAVCLFGTEEFTRQVASIISNVAMAANPRSKMVSAESLLVAPDASMLLVHIVHPHTPTAPETPRVTCDDASSLALRIASAVDAARSATPSDGPVRLAVEVARPDAGASAGEVDQLAHHVAILLLDAFCAALEA